MRINAITGTATSPASDDYIELDGTTNGTRKITATNFKTITSTGSTTGRTLENRFAEQFNVKDYGAACDGVTDDTAAVNAAIAAAIAAGGGEVLIDGASCKCNGQILIDGSDITIKGGGGRRNTLLNLTYTAAAAIVIGNASTQRADVLFRDIWLQGASGGTLVWTKYVRGTHFYNCRITADRWLEVGDSSAGSGNPAFIVSTYDCELFHVTSPTKHFVNWQNFSGQWDFQNSFAEGRYTAGLDGIYSADNTQNTVDHVIISGGYWSRFRDNYSFTTKRVVNLSISDDHHTEGALRNAVRLYRDATAGATGGFENIYLAGKYQATEEAIYIRSETTDIKCDEIIIGDVSVISATKTPIFIQSDAGIIRNIVVDGVNAAITPGSATEKIVWVVGSNSTATIKNVVVDNVAALVTGTALEAIVEIQGNANEGVRVGGNLVSNSATLAVQANSVPCVVAPSFVRSEVKNMAFGTLNGNTGTSLTVAITGALSGDEVGCTFGTDPGSTIGIRGFVSASNVVQVNVSNCSASSVTVGTRNVRVTVNGWR